MFDFFHVDQLRICMDYFRIIEICVDVKS